LRIPKDEYTVAGLLVIEACGRSLLSQFLLGGALKGSIAELCCNEGIGQSLYYTWSREFMATGKPRLAGETARAATTGEVQDLRREARALKECIADLTLENRLLKKA
jgi:transposase